LDFEDYENLCLKCQKKDCEKRCVEENSIVIKCGNFISKEGLFVQEKTKGEEQ